MSGSLIGWIPFALWNVTRVVLRVVDRVSAARYEQVRAQATVTILRSLPSGIAVHDQRSDGTILAITADHLATKRVHDPEDPGVGTELCG